MGERRAGTDPRFSWLPSVRSLPGPAEQAPPTGPAAEILFDQIGFVRAIDRSAACELEDLLRSGETLDVYRRLLDFALNHSDAHFCSADDRAAAHDGQQMNRWICWLVLGPAGVGFAVLIQWIFF